MFQTAKDGPLAAFAVYCPAGNQRALKIEQVN
jgi:hypothetical protein